MTWTRLLAASFLLFLVETCQTDGSKTPTAESGEKNLPTVSHSKSIENDPSHGSDGLSNLVSDFENPNRSVWQKPEMVINLLGDLEGKTVADIGAGTGYFAFRLVPKAQKVVAIEIDQRLINFMDSIKIRLPETLRFRFETRLASPENPRLQPAEADAVTIVNTYGYIENRTDYLKILRKGMKTGATLLIIDFKKNLPVGPAERFKASLAEVETELKNAGFELTREDTKSLDFQYIVLARNPK